jgi:hypothetical protein
MNDKFGRPIKTDNASLYSKLAIRRWLLSEMGLDTVSVLDACAGAGRIWTAMRKHVTIERWVRCDIKPRQPGTLRLSAVDAMNGMALDRFNVIDIDPYGEPWEAYMAALKRLRRPTAMFLTRGRVLNTVTTLSMRTVAGLPLTWPVPQTPVLAAYLDSCLLAETWRYATVHHAAQIEKPHVVYYALGLSPL